MEKKRINKKMLTVLLTAALTAILTGLFIATSTGSWAADSNVLYRGSTKWTNYVSVNASTVHSDSFEAYLFFTLCEGSDLIGIHTSARWTDGEPAIFLDTTAHAFQPNDTGIHTIKDLPFADDYKAALFTDDTYDRNRILRGLDPLMYGITTMTKDIDFSDAYVRHGREDILLKIKGKPSVRDKDTVIYAVEFLHSNGSSTTLEIPYTIDMSISERKNMNYLTEGDYTNEAYNDDQLIPAGPPPAVIPPGANIPAKPKTAPNVTYVGTLAWDYVNDHYNRILKKRIPLFTSVVFFSLERYSDIKHMIFDFKSPEGKKFEISNISLSNYRHIDPVSQLAGSGKSIFRDNYNMKPLEPPAIDFVFRNDYDSYYVPVEDWQGPVDLRIFVSYNSDQKIENQDILTMIVKFFNDSGKSTDFEIAYQADGTPVSMVTAANSATANNASANSAPVQTVPLPESLSLFSDASGISSWSLKFLDRMVQSGIISGYPDGGLRPKTNVTRAEFTKMIMSGLKIPPGNPPKGFSDVKASDWYREFVDLASSYDIAKGVSATAFAPNANISRQDLAVIAYRTLIHLDANIFAPDGSKFTDDDKIAAYAKDAVYALKQMGIISGRPDGSFDPKAPATREETAKIICNVKDIAAVW